MFRRQGPLRHVLGILPFHLYSRHQGARDREAGYTESIGRKVILLTLHQGQSHHMGLPCFRAGWKTWSQDQRLESERKYSIPRGVCKNVWPIEHLCRKRFFFPPRFGVRHSHFYNQSFHQTPISWKLLLGTNGKQRKRSKQRSFSNHYSA